MGNELPPWRLRNGLSPDRRREMAESLRLHRKHKYRRYPHGEYRNIKLWINKRNLVDYDHELSLPEGTLLSDLKDALNSNPSRPINVADIGCGRGNVLRQVKHHFGDRVHTTGVALSLEKEWRHGIDTIRIGSIEKLSLPEFTFDRVYAVHVMQYARDPVLGIENVYNSLRLGGRLFMDLTWFHSYLFDKRMVNLMNALRSRGDLRGLNHHAWNPLIRVDSSRLDVA